jgi:cell shape-determining protein MreD
MNNKLGIFKYLPSVIIIVFLLLLVFMNKFDNYILLSITILVLYNFILLLSNYTPSLLIFFSGILIDSFYDLKLGSITLFLILSAVLIDKQKKKMKNQDFVKSYVFFIINFFIYLGIILIINLITPIGFTKIFVFVIASLLLFPIIFVVIKFYTTIFYIQHE